MTMSEEVNADIFDEGFPGGAQVCLRSCNGSKNRKMEGQSILSCFEKDMVGYSYWFYKELYGWKCGTVLLCRFL